MVVAMETIAGFSMFVMLRVVVWIILLQSIIFVGQKSLNLELKQWPECLIQNNDSKCLSKRELETLHTCNDLVETPMELKKIIGDVSIKNCNLMLNVDFSKLDLCNVEVAAADKHLELDTNNIDRTILPIFDVNTVRELVTFESQDPSMTVPVVDCSRASVASQYMTPPQPLPAPSPMTLKYDYWKQMLLDDFDKEYLLAGVKNGFKLVDDDIPAVGSIRNNYRSALKISKIQSEAQIQTEIDLCRYIVTTDVPFIVSSLGAIPKRNDRVRLIHDLSRPDGGINALATDTSVSYSTIDDAVKLIKPHSYLAKVDLQSAYRSVPIHPNCFNLMGLQWTFEGDSEPTYMYD
jgi:hypothetical protein